MENSSTSKLRRKSLVPARSKGQHIDNFKRGNNHLAEVRAEYGRRHEFSLDSLDKEILQTMSRGSKNTNVNLPSDSASESSGSTEEKAVCSRESPHPGPVPYSMSNGAHSSESTSKTSKKPSEQHHGSSNVIGQFHAPPLPMWPGADARSNGYKQQVSVNVNGDKHQQDPSRWHCSVGVLHRSRGNNDLHKSQLKDSSFRDVHSLNSRLNASLSSDTTGEDIGEERKKQASEVPYSGSMSVFAYPGTPQRLFPGGHRNDAECPNVANVAMGSPGYERATRTHCAAQYSGGQSLQRSATKSTIPKAPPSKWDDAGKWIVSPSHNDSATTESARSNHEGLVPSSLLLPGMRLADVGQVLDDCHELDSPNLAAPIVDPSFSPNDNRNTSSVDEKSTRSSSGTTSSLNENSTSSISEQTSSLNENSTSSISEQTSLVNGNTSPDNGNTRSVSGSTSLANGNTSSVRVKDHIKQIESAIQSSLAKGPSVSDLAKRREASRAGAKCAGGRRDTTVITSTMFILRPKDSRLDALISPPKLLVEPQAAQNPVSIFPTEKPPLAVTPTDAPLKDIFSNDSHLKSISDFPSSIFVRESGTDTAQPASSLYRDMGTQMTPNPSVRLSRGETPRTFNVSPSRHNTPDHSRRATSLGAPANADMIDLQSFHIEMLGRRNLGAQPHPVLDRNLNWSTREEEEEESATCLRTQDCGQTQTSPYMAWAAAWEEAERAKYTARFHQEVARIQASEELQKAKAETQMRKTEVKLAKLHESASQKMSNKIAAAHRKAEDMRAAAEVCRDEHATKAKRRADHIRQTGNAPTALGCFASRLVPFQSNLQ